MADRSRIKSALQYLLGDGFGDRAAKLLNVLGYNSTRVVDEMPVQSKEFIETYTTSTKSSTKSEDAFVSEARSVQVLFQVTDSEMDGQARLDTASYDKSMNKSFLFVAVELQRTTYSRGRYASFTREINKRLKIPAVVLFRTPDSKCTLGFVHRREGIRDPSHHVLERVSLIREINSLTPHRAHVDILHSLSMPERLEWIVNNRKRRNFDGLHDAWLAALDTEELNKRFYRDLYDWLERAVEQASLPTNIQPQEHMLRLITRLLFVWFVKQKGLVNNYLFNEHEVRDILVCYDSGGDSYYRVILQNLFFATLNTEIGRRGFGDTNTSYHYKHEIRDAEALLRLFNQTPFVNGGLFDCMDEEDNRTDYFVDDISERRGYSIPNWLFFGDGYNPGLVTILNKYHFTVEESTPLEQEVALDPELLGRVFENLLAAYNPETRDTVRKQTGSYYTPREVVDYIVDKTLAVSLAGKACNSAEAVEEKTQKLLDYSAIQDDVKLTYKERNGMVRAISEIKILDPAVGSGAFLMSVLNKLTLVLNRIDPENKIWMKLQKDMARERVGRIFESADTDQREKQLQQTNMMFKRYSGDFGRKLYLIQNNIYGVDIQPIAIQIAKLRFFISLAIEQDVSDTNPQDNYGVQPLPNLETRFVAANTLVPLIKTGQQTIGQTDDDIQRLESELADNREQYFLANSPETKTRCRSNDESLRNQLAEAVNRAGDAGYVNEMIKWDPYDQNHSSDWFDAKYMFGVSGFDAIVGNPPYIRHQDIINKAELQVVGGWLDGVTIPSMSDYSIYFWLHSLNNIKKCGVLGFISSDGWMSGDYGEPLRSVFVNMCDIRLLARPDFRVFVDAAIRTIICVVGRGRSTGDVALVDARTLNDLTGTRRYIEQSSLGSEKWNIHFEYAPPEPNIPMTKLASTGNVKRGKNTGHNPYFVLDGQTIQKHNIASVFLVPLISHDMQEGLVYGKCAVRWLLNVSQTKSELLLLEEGRHVLKYIMEGEHTMVKPRKGKDRSLRPISKLSGVIGRKLWYNLQLGNAPAAFLSRFAGERHKFYENGGDIYAQDNFECYTPSNERHVRPMLAYLACSWFGLYQELHGHPAGAGALQFRTNDYKNAPCPDFAVMSDMDMKRWSTAWHRYCEDLNRHTLDDAVMSLLGLSDSDTKEVRDALDSIIKKRMSNRKG